MSCSHSRGTSPPTSVSTSTWTRTSSLFYGPPKPTFFCPPTNRFNVTVFSGTSCSVVEDKHNKRTRRDRRENLCLLKCDHKSVSFAARAGTSSAGTRKAWCRCGTRTRSLPRQTRSSSNLSSGFRPTGTAPTASGILIFMQTTTRFVSRNDRCVLRNYFSLECLDF